MLNRNLFVVALLALSLGAFAQQPPTGGGQFQQIPPRPIPQRPAPEIRIEKGSVPAIQISDQVRIPVQSLRVTGQTVYSEAELVALTDFKPGSELNLTELRAMAARITDHYQRNGYVVAQAYLPAQGIKDGVVTIAVLEGKYGKITLRNQSSLSDGTANGILRGLNSGDTISIAPLERRLLLLSDLPGVVVKSTLVPGAAVGESDLIVEVTPGRRVTGSVDADNAGNRYTGENRLGGTINLLNPTGHGDVFSLRVLGASGLAYGRASYETQVGQGRVGVAYTALAYRLQREFAGQGHGTAEVASIYGTYPLIRSRNTNLYALVEFDYKTFEDKLDAALPPNNVTNKRAGVFVAGLFGDHRDRFGGGGYTTYSLFGSFGDLDIRTQFLRDIDAITARTNGSYGKLAFQVTRLQTLGGPFSLYAALRGQVASKNLDISEKMELGGMYAVRAYPEGEAYGDEGYVATLEARMLLPQFYESQTGRMNLIGFVDTGTVTINKNPWAAGQNNRTLSAAGVGLTWEDYNNFTVRAYYARKLGDNVATSAPDKNGRFWIQGVKYF